MRLEASAPRSIQSWRAWVSEYPDEGHVLVFAEDQETALTVAACLLRESRERVQVCLAAVYVLPPVEHSRLADRLGLELRECPWHDCGRIRRDGILVNRVGRDVWWVECAGCGACGPRALNPETAAWRWNAVGGHSAPFRPLTLEGKQLVRAPREANR